MQNPAHNGPGDRICHWVIGLAPPYTGHPRELPNLYLHVKTETIDCWWARKQVLTRPWVCQRLDSKSPEEKFLLFISQVDSGILLQNSNNLRHQENTSLGWHLDQLPIPCLNYSLLYRGFWGALVIMCTENTVSDSISWKLNLRHLVLGLNSEAVSRARFWGVITLHLMCSNKPITISRWGSLQHRELLKWVKWRRPSLGWSATGSGWVWEFSLAQYLWHRGKRDHNLQDYRIQTLLLSAIDTLKRGNDKNHLSFKKKKALHEKGDILRPPTAKGKPGMGKDGKSHPH